jgi:hypothetical protein
MIQAWAALGEATLNEAWGLYEDEDSWSEEA